MLAHCLGDLAHPLRDAHKIFVGDVLAIHANTLFEVDQVGAGEQTDLEARLLQDLRKVGTSGALAVGTGNMHETQGLMRVAQAMQKLLDAAEPQAHVVPARLVDVGDGVECVIHDCIHG